MGFSGGEREYLNTHFQTNFKFLTFSIRACAIQLTFFKMVTPIFFTYLDRALFSRQFFSNYKIYICNLTMKFNTNELFFLTKSKLNYNKKCLFISYLICVQTGIYQ